MHEKRIVQMQAQRNSKLKRPQNESAWIFSWNSKHLMFILCFFFFFSKQITALVKVHLNLHAHKSTSKAHTPTHTYRHTYNEIYMQRNINHFQQVPFSCRGENVRKTKYVWWKCKLFMFKNNINKTNKKRRMENLTNSKPKRESDWLGCRRLCMTTTNKKKILKTYEKKCAMKKRLFEKKWNKTKMSKAIASDF